jgi:hypothetical protein
LAKTVHAALSLFMSGRIPGKVIVHDCREPVLEVDAFAQAIGGNEDGLVGFGEACHPFPSFFRGEFARDGIHGSLREERPEVLGDVVSRGDVPAEDDRPSLELQELCQVFAQSLELGVSFASAEGAGLFDEFLELVGLHDGTRRFHVGGGAEVVVGSVLELSIIREGGNFLGLSFQACRECSFGGGG